MSEQDDEQRPLTRRERRLREMAETGALDLSEIGNIEAAPKPATPEAETPEAEIEISPFHEDGTPRSRREMRELREQALAERAALREANAEGAGPAEDTDVTADSDSKGGEAKEPAAPEAEAAAAADQPSGSEVSAEDQSEPAEEAAAVEEPASAEEPSVDADPEPIAAPIPAVRPTQAEPAQSEAGDEEQAAEESKPAADEEPAAAASAEEPASDEAADAPDFDTLIAPPTEPFTVAELREAETPSGEPETVSAEEPAEAEPDAEDPAPAEEPAPAAEKPKRRFPWQRKAAGNAAAEGAGEEQAAASEDPATAEPEVPATAEPEVPAAEEEPAPAEADQPMAETAEAAGEAAAQKPVFAPEPVADEEAAAIAEIADPVAGEAAAEPAEENPSQKATYSFPDIAPPEEWRSVFDDPSSRKVPDQGGQGGDFDDLISRAVAQEGTSTTAGTSALILPAMPEDTGGLAGPIGTTGELYVTGSLKLPKSLGETGGHSALHDSIEMDPITGEETGDPGMASEGPAPVSARHAVSARAASGVPVVAKPARERSKLPLVLSLTGGGLLVAVVALGVWGASNGMFG